MGSCHRRLGGTNADDEISDPTLIKTTFVVNTAFEVEPRNAKLLLQRSQ